MIDRLRMIHVDGHRAILPLPDVWSEGGKQVYCVTQWPYVVARLLNDLDGHDEFERYFKQSIIERASS